MARKKGVGSAKNDQEERNQLLESFFAHIAQENHARREFALSLKSLRNAIQTQQAFSSENEWLLCVEQSAARVREACSLFQDNCADRRQEVYRLLRSIEHSTTTSSPNETSSLDPSRVMLACHSFMASYRLQAQMDEQVMDEILSFLSCLYANIGFLGDYGESMNGGSERNNMIEKFNGWIENMENQVFLTWQAALQEMYSFCVRAGGTESKRKHYHTMADESERLTQSRGELSLNSGFQTPVKNRIAGSDSIMGAVDSFLEGNNESMASLSVLLVVGPEGSGKSFLCDEIERKAMVHGPSIQVIRPTLPINLMGASLGETEDTIASIFEFARQSRKCILVLDDIDHILGDQDGNARPAADGGILVSSAQPHYQTRLVASFLSHLDSLRAVDDCQVLVIGTTSIGNNVDAIGRVDKVFSLDLPGDTERRDIIVQALNVSTSGDSLLLNDLVDCTVGRSRSELVQYCRQAFSSSSFLSSSTVDGEEILRRLKGILQSLAPESLRSGVVSDFVDMRVLSAKDLLATTKDSAESQFPLFGDDANQAWDELNSLIVMPLCQANELDSLLYGDNSVDRKTVCGGVLLCGSPGSGKSCLAYHCASVAANLVPSITLLDVSCTSLVHKEVGGSERALRHLFSSAKAASPCILLMDGIENIAAVRGHDNTTEGTMDRILSTLLIELDGVESQSDGGGKVAVIGITHNEKWIDSALRRPGRLEKVIRLRNPDYNARYQIVHKELSSLSVPNSQRADTSELANFVARRTEGMSGAEVLALCRETRLEKAREYIHDNNNMLGEIDGSVGRVHFFAAGLRE